jgi:hypothetical protein
MDHEPLTRRTVRRSATIGADPLAEDGSRIMRDEADDEILAAERELRRHEVEQIEAEREAQQETGLVRGKEKREQLKLALLRHI